MAVDQLLKSDRMSKSWLGYGRDAPMFPMKTVLHLHLFSILLQYGRWALFILFMLAVGGVGGDAEIFTELSLLEVRVQLLVVVDHARHVPQVLLLVNVLWLFAAERGEHSLLVWVLVDLLQVCLLIAGQILEVSYIVLCLDISTATCLP